MLEQGADAQLDEALEQLDSLLAEGLTDAPDLIAELHDARAALLEAKAQ